ncbi:MAG: hypothetical protein LLG04_14040 [Parachlamydia sp.]|nr:hypothetical protein [Parachlamydia sp.]
MSLQATIVTRTRTDVTVRADLRPQDEKKRTKLSPEEIDRVRKRSNELVNIIRETPPKKHEALTAAWSEWGLLTRKKAKHTTAELEEKLEEKVVKIKELEKKIEKLNVDLAYSEGAVVQQAEEYKETRQKFGELRKRVAELEKQKSTVEGRVDELTKSNKGSIREQERLQAELAKLQKEREEDSRERKLLLQRREEQSKCLEQAKKSYEEERDKRCLYADELRLEIASREEFRADNLKQNERIVALEQAAATKEKTREEQEALLKRQLEDSRAGQEDLQQKLARLSSESAEKQARIDAQGVEITRLKGNLTALNQTAEAQRQTIDSQSLTIRNQTRDLAACITERDELREKRDDRVKLQDKIDELQHQVELKTAPAQNGANPKTKKPRRK